ncbi:carboxypeptidase B-like [Amphiura filiformis]|uniref:carboxypeptidase B-like n=1 Tax=Amphiura filiformis TaxID=82378 RepID=UPI003B224502
MAGLCQVIAIIVGSIAISSAYEVNYNRYEVLRVTPKDTEEVNFLQYLRSKYGNELDFWVAPRSPGLPVDIMVPPGRHMEIQRQLRLRRFDFVTMIPDVQMLIDEEVKSKVNAEAGSNLNYTLYNDYDTIQAWIDKIVSDYPHIASKEVLGKSHEGRDIHTLKLGKAGENKPIIFYNGGTHAREWIGPATVIYMAKLMTERYGKFDEITGLLNKIDWYITPVLNADGYIYSFTKDRNWRKTRSPNANSTCVRTDPNRNWDIHWDEVGASSDPCNDSYAGSKAFSEPEIKAISDKLTSLKDRVKVYIDFHSYSQLWMTPYGWTPDLPPDYSDLKKLGEEAVKALKAVNGTEYMVGSISNIIYPASGSSADWTYGVAKIKYSYGVELRDTGEYGFLLPSIYIEPSGLETFNAMKVLGHHILKKYT